MAESNKEKATEDDPSKLKKLQTDLDKMKKIAKKLLQQKQNNELKVKDLESKLAESLNDKNELNKEISRLKIEKEKESLNTQKESIDDSSRANALKSKMDSMTEMISRIQNNHELAMNEMEDKLTVSLRRTEEMNSYLNENKTLKAKYNTLLDTLNEEEERSKSLMELNEALKRNIINLHSEKDDLEENIEKYMESNTQNTNKINRNCILSLRSKSLGFKESINGLKDDMESIAIGFKEELLSSTKGLTKIHEKHIERIQTLNKEKVTLIKKLEELKIENEQIQEKNEQFIASEQNHADLSIIHQDHIEQIETLNKEKESLNKKLEELKIENEQIQQKNEQFIASEQSHNSISTQLMKELKNEKEEKGELKSLYDTLIRDCKDIEQHLNDVENEYNEYKIKNEELKENIDNKYKEKYIEKENIFNENINKILAENQGLKQEIKLLNDKINEKHKHQMNIIIKEKEDILKKYNDLYKLNEETETELRRNKNEIDELMCNKQNINTESPTKPIGIKRTQTPIHKPVEEMDFSSEIHKQLKDQNVSLENELNTINEQLKGKESECNNLNNRNDKLKGILADLQTNNAKLTEDNKTSTAKIGKYSQNLKVALTKLKQYKSLNTKNEKEKKEIQIKYDKLMNEYSTLEKKMVDKVNDLKQRVAHIKDINDKYNDLDKENKKINELKIKNEAHIKRLGEELKQLKDIDDKYSHLKKENNKINDDIKRLEEELKDINAKYHELDAKYNKMSDVNKSLKDKLKKLKVKKENDDELNDKYNELERKYTESSDDLKQLNVLKVKNEDDIKRLEKELNNKNLKLKEITEDHASNAQQKQILQMEYDQMKQRTSELEQNIENMQQKHDADTDKLKHKYKAYITKQKKEINTANKSVAETTQKLESLQDIEQQHNELKQKHNALNKEYENKAIMANEYETQTKTKHERLKQEFDTAQIERNEIQKRYQSLSNEYEVIKAEIQQLKTDKMNAETKINEMETTHKDAFAKYKEKAKHVVNKHKANSEKQINDIKNQLKDITQQKNTIDGQYKELLTQNEQITTHFNSMKQQNEELHSQLSSLSSEITQQKQTKSVFEQSISDLNSKLRSNQTDLDKLSKQVISLKETNDDLENKMRTMTENEQRLKEELESYKTMSNKHEATLNKISSSLGECSFFKSNDTMSIIEGVNKLAQNYEDITIKHSETQSNATDNELKLKEHQDKIKRLAVTVRKLQTVRKQLQQSLESTKEKLKETVSKSEQYYKSLQTIHTEIQRSLDKWKVFINETVTVEQSVANSPQSEAHVSNINETDQEYLKRCLSDVRSLTMYFIQSLDMYREKHEQHEGATSEMEQSLIESKSNIESLTKDLEEATKRIESVDNSQIAKNAHIEKLTEKLNHSIDCIKDNWHYDITKADFVDLAVSTRLVLEDRIWCLIRWRHKLPDIPSTPTLPPMNEKNNDDKDTDSASSTNTKKKKYNDEYFWSSQTTYLNKLNVKENEIYLPDFFENKLENQITKSLETKWKAIQRRTDRQIQELKSQKLEEEEAKKTSNDQFKQYKAKAKVILQKQKDELSETQQQIKALEPLREEVTKLKEQLSSLSTENWAQKYEEIEKQLSGHKSDSQSKKLELAESQSKLLLKERELSVMKEEFEKEKDEIRSEFEAEKVHSKKKYAAKLDDYRQRAREMLEEKDKQLSIARNRLKNARNGGNTPSTEIVNYDYNVKYDKETQTEYAMEYNINGGEYQGEVPYSDGYANDVDNKNVITSTDDLVAALQPPLNATIDDKDKKSKMDDKDIDDVISASNIAALARMQTQRDHKIREFQDRLRRLQELLNKSEEQHKDKDSELHYLKGKFEQIEQAKDVKKSADNSEYLKNALLQYFDGKININQLVSVVSVGLSFNAEEEKKAQNSKLIIEQSGLGGYVKSWWG